MKRLIVAAILGAAVWFIPVSPARANVLNPQASIRVLGLPYMGTWAMIGDRPYVNVESFGHALGLPRVHNVKNWYLGADGKPKGSPFQLAVETAKGVLPTIRFGGATMVDLESALDALDIPWHYDTQARVFEVGDPYAGEWMVGAWYRWFSNTRNYYAGTVGYGKELQGMFQNPNPTWPVELRYPYARPRPYPDNYRQGEVYKEQSE